MSKNRKRLMRSSLVMLIVAAVALSSATYAWFSNSDKGEVTEIVLTAETSDGIQISADALTWKSTLPSSEISTAQKGTLAGMMTPVSTTATVTNGAISLFKASFEAAGTIKSEAACMSSASNNGYYVFDLYFKNDGATDKTLYLDRTSTVVGKDDTDTNDNEITGIENAVRVAFIDEGTGVTDTTTQTVALVKAANSGTTALIWEPNAKTHTSYATTYRYVVGNDGSPTDALATNNTAYPYVGISAESTGITASKGAAIVVDGKSAVLTSTSVDQNNTGFASVATLPANKIVKVTVYMWLEGQDIDCNNAESGGMVTTNLKFTTDNT